MADETISVELGAEGNLGAAADSAAASVLKLDAASKGLESTLEGLKSDYKALESAAREATDPETFLVLRGHADKAAAAIAKIEKELEAIDDEKKSLTNVGEAADSAAADAKQLDNALEKVGDNKGGLDALGASFANFAGEILAKATEKVIEFGVEAAKAIAEATIEADRSKRSAKGLLETYEGADAAADHYAKLSDLAKQLGVDANGVTKDFVEFNKKLGLTESASVGLIKLKADVEAIAPGTGRAEEATARFLDLVNHGMSAEHALKTVAEEFHVAGTGADAAAAKLNSPSAAIDDLKLKGQELAGQLATKLGPKIIETADKFAAWVDKPETMAAIEKATNLVGDALELVVPTIEVVTAAFDAQSTSSYGVMAAGQGLAGVVKAAAAPFTLLYDSVVLVTNSYEQHTAGITATVEAVGGAADAVGAFVSEWTQAGTDLVEGFIEGITAAAGRAVAKARELGAAATAEMKSVLGIKSPSKVFEEIGGYTAEGFEKGLEPVDIAANLEIPDAVDAVNENVSAPAADAAPRASAGAGSSGGTIIVQITINGGDLGAVRREVREAITDAAEQMGWAVQVTGREAA